MNKLIIDYGTSSCRASLVDDTGRITASCRKTSAVIIAGNNAEIDLDFAWKTMLSVINELIKSSSNINIRAVGVSSLLGWVFLDSGNIPIENSIIWMDSRTDESLELKLKEQQPDSHQKTGRRLSAELLISKWAWMKKNRPEICEKTSKIISLKDELVRRLTGTIVSDYAHLNYTMLWNIREHRLDSDMLKIAELPPALLPDAAYPYDQAGKITPEAARLTGLSTGTPVIVGSIDGTTAMYGGGMAQDGTAALVSGTTDVLMCLTDSAGAEIVCKNPLLTLNTGFIPERFAAGGSTGLSGGALKKMVELFGGNYSDILSEAGEIAPGSDGLIFNPGFSGERAPYWNSDISGSFIGLRMDHSRGHIIRALMEGASFRLKRLYNELLSGIERPDKLNIIGGNTRIDHWNSIKADVLNVDLSRPIELEATTIGTALFCDSFLSDCDNLAALSRGFVETEKTFRAESCNIEKYNRLFEFYEEFLTNNIDNFTKLEKIREYCNGK